MFSQLQRAFPCAVLLAGLLVAVPVASLHGQDAPGQAPGRGAFVGMPRVAGQVTAVNGATLTVKAIDGTTYQVITTDNTRILRGRGQDNGGGLAKIADLHAGDSVMAVGVLDGKTLHAAMIASADPAQAQAMRANLGKTFITGRVTALDLEKVRATVQRPDGVAQTIAFDETTSFRRGGPQGESITLADIKVGENVAGQGVVKNGTFVPTQLIVGGGPGGFRGGPRHASPDAAVPAPH